MNMRYNEDGTVTPLPPIVVECPIHGECAECVQLAETIEAYARGRADALVEVKRRFYAMGPYGNLNTLLRRMQDPGL